MDVAFLFMTSSFRDVHRLGCSLHSADGVAGKATRHLRCSCVLCLADGTPITRDRVIKAIRGAQRVAHTQVAGVHVLRHTFCSHLAMKGAPARAIQELAGHADLTMTQHYMHLSPSATEDAIRLLDDRHVGVTMPIRHGEHCGDGRGRVWNYFWGKGLMERATGIEPVSEAWEASVLPLY